MTDTAEATTGAASLVRPKLVLDFDLRHPPQLGASGPATYAAALDIIGWADRVGFERVGFGEHHQSDDGYLPCPLVFAPRSGARTRRIRVRISILLAPLYDPLRLAEEVAVADLCTQGRLDLALGVGYVEDDFVAFGKDYHRRGRDLEELVPFLRRAWTGEPFEHRGAQVRVMPRPCQDPMPIFLGGGAARKSIERAAAIADGFFPPGMPKPWEFYRQACAELGKPDPGEWAPRGPIFLWITNDDKDETWRKARAPHPPPDRLVRQPGPRRGSAAPPGRTSRPRTWRAFDRPAPTRSSPRTRPIQLAAQLGPRGELHLNPLLRASIPVKQRPCSKRSRRKCCPSSAVEIWNRSHPDPDPSTRGPLRRTTSRSGQ